jgi:hypothetical protein
MDRAQRTADVAVLQVLRKVGRARTLASDSTLNRCTSSSTVPPSAAAAAADSQPAVPALHHIDEKANNTIAATPSSASCVRRRCRVSGRAGAAPETADAASCGRRGAVV